jgi:hypothetical protein
MKRAHRFASAIPQALRGGVARKHVLLDCESPLLVCDHV